MVNVTVEGSSKSDIIYSNRQLDLKQENVIHQYMTMLYDEHGFSVKQPTKEQDISGIDVILNRYNKEYLVDENAAIKYLTRDLNTFSFELYKAGYRNSVGWFVDKNKLTTYYNIIYPKSFTNDIYNLDSIEAFLLNSKELQEAVFPEIQKHKIHFDNIEEFMLNQSSYKGRRYFVINQYMKLVYSECIRPEKPINIVINKQYLRDIACDIFYKDFRKK